MKKILCLIFVILLLIPSYANAEETLTICLENYQTQPNTLSVYFNTNLKQELSLSQLSLSLSGEMIPISDIKTIASAEQGTSYIFLVDVSGSIKEQKLSEMKDILSAISNKITEKDNAAIMLVGNNSKINPFEYGNEKLQEQIDAIETSSDDTNLYSAIIEALDIMNTNNSVQAKKCLVILSDGKDDYTTGYTREEVNTKIEASNVPIYTIAMLSPKASSELLDASKVLGSFARLSAGGLDITFGLDKTTAANISKSITESVAQGYILTADISNLNITSDQGYLEIKLDAKENGIATDGYMITTATIKNQIVATPTEEAPESTLVPTDTASVAVTDEQTNSDSEDTEISMIWIYIGTAAAIFIVITILLLIFIKYKKTSSNQEMQNIEPNIEQENVAIHNDSKSSQIPLSKIELHFTKVGLSEGKMFTVPIDKELIIGRDPVKSQFTFAKDDLLSSQHCKITYSNNQLYIEDLNSTNGSFLNGIPLKQSHLLEQDDIIMIGSMELRITWRKLR